MNPGLLRHRVQLQAAVEARVSSKVNPQKTYATYATVYAAINPMSGREFWNARQVDADVTGRVVIRFRTDVQAKHKIVFGTRTFEIASPPMDMDGKRRYLEMIVKETP